ncbi:DUF4173 domain-containing protein [Paenibacillus campi]|uniref:DUF4153 domain-containing protein n=1 Tax=Paenibacillus campi TaxID=3106031 RepID=UPI002AFE3F0E|nr:DUF4173 domain-containing protein [Paenibacillus sp. SGZ-1014]
MYQKLIVAPQRAVIACITALVLAVIHHYLFYGHAIGMSYPVFVILFYFYMYTYAGDRLRAGSVISRLLTSAIILLSLTYALFTNPLFYALNMLVVPGLILIHMAYMLSARRPHWSSPAVLQAALEQVFIHMMVHLSTPLRLLYEQVTKRMQQERKRTLARILIGIVVALPLLCVVLLLLTAADRLFGELLSNLPAWFTGLSPGTALVHTVWIVGMTLVLFAYLWGFVCPLHRDLLSGRYRAGQYESSSACTPAQAIVAMTDNTNLESTLSNQQRASLRHQLPHVDDAATLSIIAPTNAVCAEQQALLGKQTAVASTHSQATAVQLDVPSKLAQPAFPLRLDPLIVATVLVLVNLVYMLFVWLQFTYLFGAGQGKLPDGSTYAEYARSGFGELVVVTGINFTLLLSVLYRCAPASVRLTKLNRWLLFILVICSAVMLGSACTRLVLYEQAYSYTSTRFLVHAFMLLLGLLFVLAGLRIWFARLPLGKCVLLLGLSAYVILNYVGMDSWIVERNLERYAQSGQLDQDYLLHSSAETVPLLLQFAEQQPQLGLERRLRASYAYMLEQDHSWQAFDWSTYRAVRALRLNDAGW